MTQALPFQQLIPGLAQLQSLMQGAFKAQQNAGHASPLGGWMQPALTPEQIESRIAELRTVLYWLEQNVHAVKATIEAMEVQRLTFSALGAMNVNMTELAKSFRLPDASNWAAAMAQATQAKQAAQAAPTTPSASAEAARPTSSTAEAEPSAPPSASPPDLSALNPSAWLQPLAKAFAWPKTEVGAPSAGAAEAAASALSESPAPVAMRQAAPPAESEPAPTAAAEEAPADANATTAAAAMNEALSWWSTATRQFQALAGSALQNHASADAFLEASQRAQQAMSSGAQDMAEVLKSAAAAPIKAASDMAQAARAQTMAKAKPQTAPKTKPPTAAASTPVPRAKAEPETQPEATAKATQATQATKAAKPRVSQAATRPSATRKPAASPRTASKPVASTKHKVAASAASKPATKAVSTKAPATKPIKAATTAKTANTGKAVTGTPSPAKRRAR